MKGVPDRSAALVAAVVVGVLAVVLRAGVEAQPRRFGLRFPEEGAGAFEGNQIALTRESVEELVIDILNPTAEEIKRDRIYPWINGEAASTAAELRRTRRGLAVVLDLDLKPHLQLKPGRNTVEIVAENHRGRRFYENWIVKLRERSHSEWFTYEFDTGRREEIPAFPEVEVLLPLVPPLLPPGAEHLSVAVEARVVAYHPLASLRIDGVAAPGEDGKLETTVERRVSLPRSQRSLDIEAADERGNKTRVRIPIAAAGEEPAPRLSGRRYLLSIGISEHAADPENLPPLPGAADEAKALAGLMVERGFAAANATLVLRDRQATVARVRSALRDFTSLPGPEDLLVIYFAGYGLHGLGSEADRTFLAGADTRLEQLRATGLGLKEILRILDDSVRVRTRKVFLIFDLSNAPRSPDTLAGTNLVRAHLLNLFSVEKGRTVLVSAEVGQETPGRRDGGALGVFASALMDGLAGAADWNRDRVLTVTELFHHVTAKVSADSGGAQTPAYRIADRAAGITSLENR